jgi:hypothetical protein
MDYTLKETKKFAGTKSQGLQAVDLAVKGLQGKILKQSPEKGEFIVWFDKTIHGQVLGDRTQIEVLISEPEAGQVQFDMQSYPIDPVGRKQLFGARKGVNQTVFTWFQAHLDNQMKKFIA